eukprot:s9859_g1.t1
MLGAAPAFADKIDDAAKVLKAINTMNFYPRRYLRRRDFSPRLAHSKAIANMDAKGVATLADYTAINAAIGHMIASVPASQTMDTMDVYNAFAKFNLGTDVGPYMMSKVNEADAKAAYQALMDFKDVVKASQR